LPVPSDAATGRAWDTHLMTSLQSGNYRAAVSVYPNFGPSNLSQGFPGATTFTDVSGVATGNQRTPNFAFDVLGVASATMSTSSGGGSQTPTPTPTGPLNVIGFGRRVNADGTVTTGDDFFATINFNNTGENAIQYTDISQFNTCFVNGGCPIRLPPSEVAAPVASLATQFQLISEDVLSEEPFELTIEADDEAQADVATSPIAPPAPLIDTRPLNPELDVTEPVSGSGNPALIGTGVNPSSIEECNSDTVRDQSACRR